MDNPNHSRINQILSHLAGAASAAADGVTDVVHSAGNAVGDKYNAVKLNLEISRLKGEQSNLFGEIGRVMFLEKYASAPAGADSVDILLEKAEAKQSEIDEAAKRLQELTGERVCENCGKVAASEDVFCSRCGAKLPPAPTKTSTAKPADEDGEG